MSILAALPRVRSVDPTAYAQLDAFSSGLSSVYEQEVNEIVSGLRRGAAPNVEVRVAEDAATGELIGLCGFLQMPMVPASPEPSFEDAVHICVIGVSAVYRGLRMPDGLTRMGDFLLSDALDQIEGTWGIGQMPQVWGIVGKDNEASHRLLGAHGFELVPSGGATTCV